MLTQFQKYKDPQAKIAIKETRTTFPDFSKEDRVMIIDAMNSMKETLDESDHLGGEEPEKTDVK